MTESSRATHEAQTDQMRALLDKVLDLYIATERDCIKLKDELVAARAEVATLRIPSAVTAPGDSVMVPREVLHRWQRTAEIHTLEKLDEEIGGYLMGTFFAASTARYTALEELDRRIGELRLKHKADPNDTLEEWIGRLASSSIAATGWIACSERMPEDETPVLILRDGEVRFGERRWERPSWEESRPPFRYWDDPTNDGQDWADQEVTHWMPLPAAPGIASAIKASE